MEIATIADERPYFSDNPVRLFGSHMNKSPYSDEDVGMTRTQFTVCELCETERRCMKQYDIIACADCQQVLLP